MTPFVQIYSRARGKCRNLPRAIGLIGLSITLVLTGCEPPDHPEEVPKVSSMQQLGSVHLAALSVNYWDDYVSVLQPQFTITPNAALSQALQRSFITQNNVADILSGGIQVGLPQSTESIARTLTGTSGATANTSGNTTTGAQSNSGGSATTTGSTTTTSTSSSGNGTTMTQTTTSQQGPGTLPPSLLRSASPPNAAALAAPGGAIQLDPLLSYTAATAIYQEVQLLDSYVRDAAQRYGYIPYVARVQVSIVPFVRNEPYDAYVDIGLFARCGSSLPETKPVTVVPLLVTDDVETGQTTNAVNVARQLAASIGSTISNVALQAELSDLRSRFSAILGTDFNSLYMVSRAGDNVIQVRLGASRNPNLKTRYAMLTQTHNVSFLMLVPKNYTPDTDNAENCFTRGQSPQIRITSIARFREANTGEELPVNTDVILDRATAVMRRFLNGPQLKQLSQDKAQYKALLGALLADIQEQDTVKFKEDYCAMPGAQCADRGSDDSLWYRGIGDSLWTGLTGIVNMSEYAGTYLELPQRPTPPVDREQNQVVLLHDNCKDTLTATIGGFGTLVPNQFRGVLQLDGSETAGAQPRTAPIVLAATSISQAVPGGPFTLQFPSLKPFADKLGHAVCVPTKTAAAAAGAHTTSATPGSSKSGETDITGQAVQLAGQLVLSEAHDTRWGDSGAKFGYTFPHLYYDGNPTNNPSVGVIAAADTVTADPTGKGIIRLFVTAKDVDEVDLSFSGATLGLPLPGSASSVQTAPQPAADLKVTTGSTTAGPTVLDVRLEGLIANRAVTITAVGKTVQPGQKTPKAVPGAFSSVVLPVQAQPPTKTNVSAAGAT